MIELGIAALAGIGGAAGLLRWMNSGADGTLRKGIAVAILGAGGPGAVPR